MNRRPSTVISILITLSVLVIGANSALGYTDAVCTGDICALIEDWIECRSDSDAEIFKQQFTIENPDTTPPAGDHNNFYFTGVAVNPFTGVIYVTYVDQSKGNDIYVGTIPDPWDILTGNGPVPAVHRLGNATEKDTMHSITFDCIGKLYGISQDSEPQIWEIDLTNGDTGTDPTDTISINITKSVDTCAENMGFPTKCKEHLMQGWDVPITDNPHFIRLSTVHDSSSTNPNNAKWFYRNGVDENNPPSDDTEPGGCVHPGDAACNSILSSWDIIDDTSCGTDLEISAAQYIGNNVALVSCYSDPSGTQLRVLDLTPDANDALHITEAITDRTFTLTKELAEGELRAVFNYDHGSVTDRSQPPICQATSVCTEDPTMDPTMDPTLDPTLDPTTDPTTDPTIDPTTDPTTDPTLDPTGDPTVDPTNDPTSDPTLDPTGDPTTDPTFDPTGDPTLDPTGDPTVDPTLDPTGDPTVDPTSDPTSDPTVDPTNDPTSDPTTDPTLDPTADPSTDPTADPTSDPTVEPTVYPTLIPTSVPTDESDELEFEAAMFESDEMNEFDDGQALFVKNRNERRGISAEFGMAHWKFVCMIVMVVCVVNIAIFWWVYRTKKGTEIETEIVPSIDV